MIGDYFVCLSMLVTGRHKKDHSTLTMLDVVARDIAREEAGEPPTTAAEYQELRRHSLSTDYWGNWGL